MANTTVAINITIPPDLLARVEALADEQRRSRSNTIAQLLYEALASKRSSSAQKNGRARLAESVE